MSTRRTLSPPPARRTRAHARRLRDVYRSAGWPCQDALEIDLLAAGLLERVRSAPAMRRCASPTPACSGWPTALARNRAALSRTRRWCSGWRRRWRAPAGSRGQASACARRWRPARPTSRCAGASARPDVFSIRHTSVESYVEPIVHEIKVRRADLLADLRQEAKRAAYRDLGECWYVLGCDARGRASRSRRRCRPNAA